jgi:hypothetical protein
MALMDMNLAHGPYRDINKARDGAYSRVDPPYTLWVVIELFGPDFDRPATDGSGDTWGELWVLPDELAAEFAEAKEAESYHVVDSYGYDNPSVETE